MAAKVFQIIGIAAVVIFTLLFALVLPFLSRLLKKLNRSLADRAGGIKKQVSDSLSEMDTAQGQIEAFGAVTASVKSGIGTVISAADRLVAFLESGAFQVGLPVVLVFLMLFIGLPRGLLRRKKPRKVEMIPPPSWELE